MTDRYGSDVLSGDWRAPRRGRSREVPAELDVVVEDAQSGYVGAVVRVEKSGGQHVVFLEDRFGKARGFPLGAGFLIDGEPVTLVAPRPATAARLAEQQTQAGRTASGSLAVPGAKARVALGSRIFVEGRHDAELVEKVWGDDLRIEGVVVEYLEGVDDLAAVIRDFRPEKGRRLGILVDHLVPGTKEARIVEKARALQGPLDAWRESIESGAAIARISPFLHRQRSEFDRQERVRTHLDLATRNLRVIARRVVYLCDDGAPRPVAADLLDELAAAARLLPDVLVDISYEPVAREAVRSVATRLDPAALAAGRSSVDQNLIGAFRPLAVDLMTAAGMTAADARAALPRV